MADRKKRRPDPREERVAEDPRRFAWRPEAVALLGKLPDPAGARRRGLHQSVVSKERRRAAQILEVSHRTLLRRIRQHDLGGYPEYR